MFYLIHFSDHIKIKYKIKSFKRILIKAFKYHYKSAIDYIHYLLVYLHNMCLCLRRIINHNYAGKFSEFI